MKREGKLLITGRECPGGGIFTEVWGTGRASETDNRDVRCLLELKLMNLRGVLNREGPPGWAEHPLRTGGSEINFKSNGE